MLHVGLENQVIGGWPLASSCRDQRPVLRIPYLWAAGPVLEALMAGPRSVRSGLNTMRPGDRDG